MIGQAESEHAPVRRSTKGQLVARPAWNPSKQPLNFAV